MNAEERKMYEMTREYVEEVEDEVARMFYRMEGWERWWPYEQRPGWLRTRYPVTALERER
jgi:hypothetical protein